jgi:hypothetical protein
VPTSKSRKENLQERESKGEKRMQMDPVVVEGVSVTRGSTAPALSLRHI